MSFQYLNNMLFRTQPLAKHHALNYPWCTLNAIFNCWAFNIHIARPQADIGEEETIEQVIILFCMAI